jgi:hypothetical protein
MKFECILIFLIPLLVTSQKKAEFESEFTMTNNQGKSLKFIIGFDKTARFGFGDTVFGEYNLLLNDPNILFRSSFDIQLGTPNVISFDKSIIQSKECGDFENGEVQPGLVELMVKASSLMFPLKLKWNKNDFNNFCLSNTTFAPVIKVLKTGSVLLKDHDSITISNDMAKSIIILNKSGIMDTVRFMHFIFSPQRVHTYERINQFIPSITYNNQKLTLKNVERYNKMSIYTLEGKLLQIMHFPLNKSTEHIVTWNPPIEGVYIVGLIGPQIHKVAKIYCF